MINSIKNILTQAFLFCVS